MNKQIQKKFKIHESDFKICFREALIKDLKLKVISRARIKKLKSIYIIKGYHFDVVKSAKGFNSSAYYSKKM